MVGIAFIVDSKLDIGLFQDTEGAMVQTPMMISMMSSATRAAGGAMYAEQNQVIHRSEGFRLSHTGRDCTYYAETPVENGTVRLKVGCQPPAHP